MEFMDVFEQWANSYDDTVFNNNKDNEYAEVFKGYTEMLDKVVANASGHILEVGAGTGNLTERLLQKHQHVTAIDPSEDMRDIANQKLDINILDGHFLSIPVDETFDTIVSTYAFHHLTDEAKLEAFKYLKGYLNNGGQLIFIDTFYKSEESREQLISQHTEQGHLNLVNDLNTEYYTYQSKIEDMIHQLGGTVTWEQQNQFAWLATIKFS